MPLFWLTYRHFDGRAAGVVVIESRGLLHARLKASPAGADRQLEFASGHQLDPISAEQTPANMIGRLLDPGDLQKLHRMLIKKKPPAPSVRRRTASKRRVGESWPIDFLWTRSENWAPPSHDGAEEPSAVIASA
jgi:hypothetical protein